MKERNSGRWSACQSPLDQSRNHHPPSPGVGPDSSPPPLQISAYLPVPLALSSKYVPVSHWILTTQPSRPSVIYPPPTFLISSPTPTFPRLSLPHHTWLTLNLGAFALAPLPGVFSFPVAPGLGWGKRGVQGENIKEATSWFANLPLNEPETEPRSHSEPWVTRLPHPHLALLPRLGSSHHLGLGLNDSLLRESPPDHLS